MTRHAAEYRVVLNDYAIIWHNIFMQSVVFRGITPGFPQYTVYQSYQLNYAPTKLVGTQSQKILDNPACRFVHPGQSCEKMKLMFSSNFYFKETN